ncbi:hypothetical protein ABPG75_009597 [Micractinium tetrahymenae]
MASEEDDSLLDGLELDDLAGLAAELEALREELGEEYVQLETRDQPAGDGEEEDEEVPPLPPLPGGAGAASRQAGEGKPSPSAEAESEREEESEAEGDEESEAEEELETAALPEEEDEVEEAAKSIAAALKPLPRWAAGATRSQQPEPSAAAAPGPTGRAAGGGKAARQPQPAPAATKGKQPAAAAAGKGQKGARAKAPQPKQPTKAQQQKQQGKEKPGRKRRKTKAELAAEARKAALAAAEAEAEAAAAAAQPISKVDAVRAALEANRQLQGRLRRLLASTDRAINRNAELQQQVRTLHARKNAGPAVATVPIASGDRPAVEMPIGTSHFWGAAAGAGGGGQGGQQPPPYPDAETLQPLFKYLPFSFRSGRWSEEEQQRLREGVLQLVQEVQLHEVMQEMQQRLESGGSVSLADLEASKQRIADLALDSPVVSQLAAGFREDDWAKLVQRTRLHRTTTECRLQWANCLSSSLSQQPWSQEEDAHLQALVHQYRQRQWEAVSRDLAALSGGGVRPPLSCLQRYQQLVTAAAKESRQFEVQEGIARLSVLVAKHGGSWKRIAEEFGGGWEPDQLMHIWRRHAQRGAQARRGKWSQEEDDLLLKAMALHGRKWSLVAKLVPGRTDVQCRERYMNVLNPEVTAWQPWSAGEEQELLDLAQQHTQEDGRVKWSAVAAHLPGRTDKQCATRWKAITSGQSTKGKKRRGGGAGGGKGKGKKRRRSSAAAAGSTDAGGEEQEAGVSLEEEQQGEGEQREQGPGEPAAAAEQQAEAAAGRTSRRPQRQRRQRRFDSDTDEEEEPPAAGAAAAGGPAAAAVAAPEPEPLLPQAPAPTASEMPCAPHEAVGQLISVWWIEEEASGAGRMYRGRITAWTGHLRAHSVRYAGEARAVRCQLAEETVEWHDAADEATAAGDLEPGARVVTGPGTPWPGAAGAGEAAGALADGGGQQLEEQQPEQQPAEQQEQQQEQQAEPPSEQQVQRPARQRRPTARAAAALAGDS